MALPAALERSPHGKSPDAFRTISEVATLLDVPQHVLRFWESRFSQVKPVKRAGARRYYRPEDVDLLKGIRHLLYTDGFTIKGVQKILKERGVRHVAALLRQPEAPKPESRPEPQKKLTIVRAHSVPLAAPEKTPSEKPVPRKRHLRAVPPAGPSLFDFLAEQLEATQAPAHTAPAVVESAPVQPVAAPETQPESAAAQPARHDALLAHLDALLALKARFQAVRA